MCDQKENEEKKNEPTQLGETRKYANSIHTSILVNFPTNIT
jgi:hypothetical protein